MSFSEDVLTWMLKRVEQGRPLQPERCDLMLVRAHRALEPAPKRLAVRGREWRVAEVGGELGLRHLLLDATPLIALLADGFEPPLDLNDRAYRRQVLRVEAQDLVAAASRRYSARIRDETLARTILEAPEVLAQSSAAWTLGPSSTTVTEDEVKSVLLARAIGLDRKLERFTPASLLARWIAEGAPQTALGALLDAQLERVFGGEGRWLVRARQPRGLRALVAAGALAGSEAGRARAAAFEVDGLDDERAWSRLRGLVEEAMRSDDRRGAEASEGLRLAEEHYHALRATPDEAGRFPLLRGALETALSELARDAARGIAPGFGVLDSLRRNLHQGELAESLRAVELAGRLSAFVEAASDTQPDDVAGWLDVALHQTAWVDLALRRLRRCEGALSADIAGSVGRVMQATLAIRDRWNARFAAQLVAEEPAVYGERDVRAALPLPSLSRALLRPLVQAGHRVFLVVLDGCDLSTFLELMRSEDGEASVHLALPSAEGGFGKELEHLGALRVGLAPLPTLTVHARRSLFAGSLPKNPALHADEASAANASADRQAFANNTSLGDIPRRLLLKDEVGLDGAPVRAALDDASLKLVAAVYNGVDDALSSHEMTAIPEWNWANLGGGLRATLRHAFTRKWTVLLTADHGHTPFIAPARKVEKGRGKGGHRWRDAPFADAIELPVDNLRPAPLYALTRTGAWTGPQVRGFHGGVSLEEVAVPLAFLGPERVLHEPWPAPAWWSGGGETRARALAPASTDAPASPSAAAAVPASPPAVGGAAPAARVRVSASIRGTTLPAALRDELAAQDSALTLIEHIAGKRQIAMSALAGLAKLPAFMVRGRLSQAQARLHAAGLTVPFDEEERDGETWYLWKELD